MPEVEVAVNVMASPSQNVEDDADDAYAVEVKLIIGLSAICTTISGEKEEQPTEGTNVSPKGDADVSSKVAINNSNLLEETNPAPYGDDNEYFKFLEDRYKKQTTVKRLQNNN